MIGKIHLIDCLGFMMRHPSHYKIVVHYINQSIPEHSYYSINQCFMLFRSFNALCFSLSPQGFELPKQNSTKEGRQTR